MASGSAALLRSAPSEQIKLGVIGSGGRGTLVMTTFQKGPSVQVGAICDLRTEVRTSAVHRYQRSGRHVAQGVSELQALEDKSVDAVLIATPEHWHARMASFGPLICFMA